MFHSANQTFVGVPEYVEVLNVRVLAIDPYGSQSSTSFIINITNNAPQVVISSPVYYCGYIQSGKVWPAVLELPEIFNDIDGH